MRDGSVTKERIERAALELFVKQGIAETTIRQIKKTARLSLGAMYVHYRSKEQLAQTLFAELFHRIGAELERLAEAEGSFPDRFRALVQHVFATLDRDPHAVPFLIRTRQEYARRVRPGAGNPFLAFRNLIVGAIERGDIPKQDATLATAMVVGAINQVVELSVAEHTSASSSALADTVAGAALRLLGR